jgi:peptidoglycan hydrolase CwlO-like protein
MKQVLAFFRRPKPIPLTVEGYLNVISKRLERIETTMASQDQVNKIGDQLDEQQNSLKTILEEVKADVASHSDIQVAALQDKADANTALIKEIQDVLAPESQPTPPATGDSSGSDSSGDGSTEAGTNAV